MADAVYCADVLYPEYSGDEDIDGLKKYVQSVSDYLFLLREGLGYTLDNLGLNNFSPTSIQAIGDVIREPVMVQITDQEGKLAEFSATLEGISSTVSEIDGNYVSSTAFTQTSGDFQFRINDGENNAAVIMDAAGLTVYKGNIVIKNDDDTNVLYADQNGNLILEGTIQGSAIYGSEIYTCEQEDVRTSRMIYIGTNSSGDPLISTLSATENHGFCAVGSQTTPWYGLAIMDGMVDRIYKTYFESQTGNFIQTIDGTHVYMLMSVTQAGLLYYDSQQGIRSAVTVDANGTLVSSGIDPYDPTRPLNYILLTPTGLAINGTVTINGRTPVLN